MENCTDAIATEIMVGSYVFMVVNVYNRPHAMLHKLFYILDWILSTNKSETHVIVVGDFNIGMLQQTLLQTKLQSFMQMKGLALKTLKPTTILGSMLDHF